jgi:hypothetical protein
VVSGKLLSVELPLAHSPKRLTEVGVGTVLSPEPLEPHATVVPISRGPGKGARP